MTALLDTHAFLWWVDDDPRLSPAARTALSDRANVIFVSAVSGWEIAVKAGLGKLTLSSEPGVFVPRHMARNGFRVLPIKMDHVLAVFGLPMHHKDPFDRLLVAQSIVENVPIISCDPLLAQYPVKIIW